MPSQTSDGKIVAGKPGGTLDAAAFDPPDVDRLYERYADSCRRLGIEPLSRERVDTLAAEWIALLGMDPPLRH